MKKLMKSLMVLTFGLVSLTGCSSQSATTDDGTKETPKEITVAFLPNEKNASQSQAAYDMLAEEIAAALDNEVEVKVVALDDYNAVSEAILTGTAQIAWESGATFVSAYLKDDAVQPILSYGPDGNEDESGYTAYIATNIAHKSDFEGKSREEMLAQLKGKSFGFVSASSTSGCLVPTTTFWNEFGPDGDGTVSSKEQINTLTDGSLFSEVQYAGSHQASVELLVNDRVYAGAYCCNYAEGYEDQLYTIDSTFVPNGPMWVNTDYLDQDSINKIIDHFENLTNENSISGNFFDADGFFYEAEGDPTSYKFFKTNLDRYQFIIDMYKN